MNLSRYLHISLLLIIALLIASCDREGRELVPRYKTSEVSFNIGIQSVTTTITTTATENNSATLESSLDNSARIAAQVEIPPRLNITSKVKISSMSEVPSQAGGFSQSDVSDVVRGEAPLYISGVSIRATHQFYTDKNNDLLTTSRNFYFADKDESSYWTVPASMNIPLGINKFVATSIPSEDAFAFNEIYEKITKYNKRKHGGSIIGYYRDLLAKEQPVYAEFTGSTSVDVQDNNPIVDIEMSTQQSRLNLVFENRSKFTMSYVIFYANDYRECNFWIEDRPKGSASAVVFNSDDLANNDINIYVMYYDRNGYEVDWEYLEYNNSYDIKAEPGVNKTLVFKFKKRR
jgi:hypothetical protein